MTVLEPIPGDFGKADWVDYSNYWREKDAEWIQDHMILRARNDVERDSFGTTKGGVVYNEIKDKLELKRAGGFSTLETLPGTLTTAEVAGPPQKTTISHTGAGGFGLTFTAAEVGVNTNLNVLGVLTVDTSGVSIRAVGAKTAKLSTSATDLVSDTPVSAPGVTITSPGSLNASGRPASVGALTAASATVNGVLTGGNGSSIGNVTFPGNYMVASLGLVSAAGYFKGQSDSALMYYRDPTTGVLGGSYLQVTNGNSIIVGGGCYMHALLRIQGAGARIYHEATGRNIAPSFYDGGSPNAASYPDGTIWIS